MNKQEALEAVLRKVRGWEQPDAEVRRAAAEEVLREMQSALTDLLADEAWDEAGDMGAYCVTLAAGALYLLVDEVTVVEVPPSPAPPQGGYVMLPTITMAAGYEPTPVNGLPMPVVAEIVGNERRRRA